MPNVGILKTRPANGSHRRAAIRVCCEMLRKNFDYFAISGRRKNS